MSKPKHTIVTSLTRRGASARPKLTGAQIVYEALRHAIVALDLAPGAALEEAQLCRFYKVSRTPVREALIRLASEDLVELEPNRGAKVASLQFVDVVDHYEAMDVFQPVTCHFAAARRTSEDLASITQKLNDFRQAVGRKDAEALIRSNYDLHGAIAAACHNRSLEKAYRKMLVDKLRVAQHGIRGSAQKKGRDLTDRFRGTLHILEKLVRAIGNSNVKAAENLARELNVYVRQQVIELFSASLAGEIELPHVKRKEMEIPRRPLSGPSRSTGKRPNRGS
jgi:DNA-binding GntR family transcriptional regulator